MVVGPTCRGHRCRGTFASGCAFVYGTAYTRASASSHGARARGRLRPSCREIKVSATQRIPPKSMAPRAASSAPRRVGPHAQVQRTAGALVAHAHLHDASKIATESRNGYIAIEDGHVRVVSSPTATAAGPFDAESARLAALPRAVGAPASRRLLEASSSAIDGAAARAARGRAVGGGARARCASCRAGSGYRRCRGGSSRSTSRTG